MSDTDKPKQKDIEKRLLDLLAEELERRLASPERAKDMSAAEMEVVRKITGDAGVTLASIKRGDWGSVAKDALEDVEAASPWDVNDFPRDGFGNA